MRCAVRGARGAVRVRGAGGRGAILLLVSLSLVRLAGQAAPITADELMSTVRRLASPEFEGRRTGTPGGLRARAWVQERFKSAGLGPLGREPGVAVRAPAGQDTYLFPFSDATVEGANVAGACAGKRPEAAKMIVSAHYDHEGMRNGAMYAGADDNASGVAVLIALAERCRTQPFSRTLIFVAFDAEERGFRGSRAFVQSPPLPLSEIALNVNLDMVARGDKGELYAAGTHPYPQFRKPLEAVAARSPIRLLLGHDRPTDGKDDWTMQSDHGPFHKAGVPFVYFGVEDHPDYHRSTDTPDKIDPKFFAAAANTILDAVRTLDAALR
jgi:Zn-dependent M28 family amino/carboxypeptidase